MKTNFSFLRGASHPDELVYRAAQLGYRAIAVTDFNSLAGAVRVHEAAREIGIKVLIGSRLTFEDAPDVLVWAPIAPRMPRFVVFLLWENVGQKKESACSGWKIS